MPSLVNTEGSFFTVVRKSLGTPEKNPNLVEFWGEKKLIQPLQQEHNIN